VRGIGMMIVGLVIADALYRLASGTRYREVKRKMRECDSPSDAIKWSIHKRLEGMKHHYEPGEFHYLIGIVGMLMILGSLTGD